MDYRGNKGSRRKHNDKDPDDHAGDYWKFSFHEIGYYDIPAVIDHIRSVTKQQKINYIGHSQGVVTMMIALSERPEYNKYIKQIHALAPVIFMEDTLSIPIRILAALVPRFLKVTTLV